ncbi:MAG: glycosyltransferase family 9 protein, partial [Planctomycetes bacterium]|nr:glycosyltransferase family 9 protein [Planctomycetota bacterium]
VAFLAEAMRDARFGRVVIVGGPETRGAVPPQPANVTIDATGALSLRELMGVINGAALVVSTDSGPFHIAGALGRPLVGLFRARRPEHAHRYPQARVVFGRYQNCQSECQWHQCSRVPCRQLESISVADVMSLVRDRLGSSLAVEQTNTLSVPRST